MPKFFNFHFSDLWEGERRNGLVSVMAATLFFTGWWIIIDVAASNYGHKDFQKIYYLCGVAGTLALLMVNMVSNSQLRGEVQNDGCCIGPRCAMMWLFVGFAMGFGSVIATGWVLFAGYIIPNHDNMWPGIALFLQNLLIFISSLVYKFGRSEDVGMNFP